MVSPRSGVNRKALPVVGRRLRSCYRRAPLNRESP
jgi:hypothetical protein